jgi:hypothetical protein
MLGFLYEKCSNLLIFSLFGRIASLGSIWCGALNLQEPFLSVELRILQGSNPQPLAVSMVCVAMEPALGAPSET